MPSVIVTVSLPNGEAGTVKVAPENVPLLVVLVVPLRLTDLPLNLAIIGEEAAKPVPDTVTVVPTLPLVGLNVMPGVTWKLVEALFFGVAESDKVTTLFPIEEAGTVNVVPEKEPAELVLVVPPSVTEEPLNVADNCELAAKPDPDTETSEFAAPEKGLKEMDEVTTNGAVAELMLSVAETVQEPAGREGTIKVAENEPEELAVEVAT